MGDLRERRVRKRDVGGMEKKQRKEEEKDDREGNGSILQMYPKEAFHELRRPFSSRLVMRWIYQQDMESREVLLTRPARTRSHGQAS